MDSLVTLNRNIYQLQQSTVGANFVLRWQFYTDILQGVYIPASKKLSSKRDFRKNSQEDFCFTFARNDHIGLYMN